MAVNQATNGAVSVESWLQAPELLRLAMVQAAEMFADAVRQARSDSDE